MIDVVVAEEFLGVLWLATDERLQVIGLLRPLAGVHSLHPLERKFHDESWSTFGELDLGVFLIGDRRVRHFRAKGLWCSAVWLTAERSTVELPGIRTTYLCSF